MIEILWSEMCGRGVFTDADDDVYDGDWVKDNKYGRGVMTMASGDVDDGECVEGTRHER